MKWPHGTSPILGLALISYCWSPLSNAASLRLAELVREAHLNQLQMKSAQASRLKAEESVIRERSSLLPDLGLRSSYSYDWQRGFQDQDSVGSSAAVLSTWSIFDNGKSLRNFEISKLESRKQQFDERTVREEVTYGLLRRYAQHLLVRRQREITELKLNMLQNQYRNTQRQYRQGLKTRRDYQRLQAELERSRLNLLRYADQVQDTFIELVRYLGRPELTRNLGDLEILRSESLLNSLQKKSTREFDVKDAPEVRSAELQVEIQKVQSRQSRAPLWPEVNLSARLGYGSDNFARTDQRWSDQERTFSGAEVQLNWTLFDWGGRSSVYRSALIDERLAEQVYHQAVLNARAALATQTRQSDRQKKTLEVVRQIFSIERKTFLDIENEYRDGRASYLDLITSLDRQAQAETELEQEINAYLLILAENLKLSGDLYDAVTDL